MADTALADSAAGSGEHQRSASSRSSRKEVPQRLGRYLVVDRIGAGGMGVVYAAYDAELNRRIAVKLLHADLEAEGTAGERVMMLRREAQAMAQLSHPNVVAVHDVGVHEGHLFIAMDYVEGLTLREWLDQTKRPWREVLGAFMQAGRGLEAAHSKGLVHRDFKPDNALVTIDAQQNLERVQVVDFGLAKPVHESRPASAGGADTTAVGGQDFLNQEITGDGRLVGTPAYMAPEQHKGERTDARTDQFAFCVALHEALYGQRPYRGNTLAELVYRTLEGKLDEPEDQRGVPAWLRKVVLRGLSPGPVDRYPSMTDLLAELAADPTVRRRWLMMGGAIVLLAGGAVGGHLLVKHQATVACEDETERLRNEAWGEDVKQEIVAAFEATGDGFAPEAWMLVEAHVDSYVDGWQAAYLRTCKVIHVEGDPNDELMHRKLACLQDHITAVELLSAILKDPNKTVVTGATGAAANLLSNNECDDARSLMGRPNPPEAPQVAAIVAEIRNQIAESQLRKEAGDVARALPLAQQAVMRAAEVDYAPLRAEAHYYLGDLQVTMQQSAKAERSLFDAIWTAEECGHDKIAARARTRLVQLVGYQKRELDRVDELVRGATAAINRVDDDALRGILETVQGEVSHLRGDYEAAERHHTRALELITQNWGADHLNAGQAHNNLGTVAFAQKDYPTALEHYQQALSIKIGARGESHTELASTLYNIGLVEANLGHANKAIASYQRSLDLLERALGANHGRVAWVLSDLADAKRMAGSLDEAVRDLERAAGIWEKLKEHDQTVVALVALAQALVQRSDVEAARSALARAVGIAEGEAVASTARAKAAFALARLEWDIGSKGPARELARSAKHSAMTAEPIERELLQEIDSWLEDPGRGGGGD